MIGIVISAVIAVFAIVILYLTRSNIIDLLDRDVVMYDKNYELKKQCLEEAFNCLDLVSQNGMDIKANPQFIARAKMAYNGLLCTLTNPKLYQEFYRIAIDTTSSGYSIEDVEKFKISCRSELIVKHKSKNEAFKGTTNGELNGGISQSQINSILQQSQPSQPARPVPQPQPPRPAQPRPAQRPQPRPQPRPVDDDDDI